MNHSVIELSPSLLDLIELVVYLLRRDQSYRLFVDLVVLVSSLRHLVDFFDRCVPYLCKAFGQNIVQLTCHLI